MNRYNTRKRTRNLISKVKNSDNDNSDSESDEDNQYTNNLDEIPEDEILEDEYDFIDDTEEDSSGRKVNGNVLLPFLLNSLKTQEDESKDWSKDLSKRQIKKLRPTYEKIKDEMIDSNPSIDKILNAKLNKDERTRCFELFNMFKNSELYSELYYHYKNRLNDLLKKAENKSEEQFKFEEKQETLFNQILEKDKDSLKTKILRLNAPLNIKKIIYEKYLKLEKMDISDSEYTNLKNNIEWSISIPYNIVRNPFQDKSTFDIISNTKKYLDSKLFGMEKVKQQLLLLLNNCLTSPNAKKAIALCGQPGVGKTSIAKTFAEAIGLPFEQISLGGAKDSTLFFGSDNVYIGSSPGIIVKLLKNMGSCDGIILFDEIDKLAETPEGREMQYALLHITDDAQKEHFRDKYLADITIDISKLWFFYSMNDEDSLDTALRDRLPIINVPNYKFDEKVQIIKNYTLPTELKDIGMNKDDLIISKEITESIVKRFENDGLRQIKKYIRELVSKINFYRNCDEELRKTLLFKIKNFKLPYTIDSIKVLDDIMEPPTDKKDISKIMMYI
jgi:ATP-dependent Lon protease